MAVTAWVGPASCMAMMQAVKVRAEVVFRDARLRPVIVHGQAFKHAHSLCVMLALPCSHRYCMALQVVHDRHLTCLQTQHPCIAAWSGLLIGTGHNQKVSCLAIFALGKSDNHTMKCTYDVLRQAGMTSVVL